MTLQHGVPKHGILQLLNSHKQPIHPFVHPSSWVSHWWAWQRRAECAWQTIGSLRPRNGFVMADVVSWRTLLIKVPGLMLSVAAGCGVNRYFLHNMIAFIWFLTRRARLAPGMSLGKEGPLVHVAVCWAQLLSRAFPQLLGMQLFPCLHCRCVAFCRHSSKGFVFFWTVAFSFSLPSLSKVCQ